ncbi:hypothetical protein LEP1GSC021_1147 [Leptospira noguchii str. 1993005606]|nr:hypothetical protein LEP1GSC021_1147 [Leptospira noguchii str. 1993005606]
MGSKFIELPPKNVGKLKHNALYESRWKLSTTLSMNRVGNSAQRSL